MSEPQVGWFPEQKLGHVQSGKTLPPCTGARRLSSSNDYGKGASGADPITRPKAGMGSAWIRSSYTNTETNEAVDARIRSSTTKEGTNEER
jgi:hypothetical protein